MAKKKKTTKKSKKRVYTKRGIKGLEPKEWFGWTLATLTLAFVTFLVYWGLGVPVQDSVREGVAVTVISLWTLISASYIFKKFKED